MSTEDIQHDIERTRDEMADTLNAIERKLSPRHIMDQAVDTMRDTMKDIASDQSRVGNLVRENPIPLALIGLGIGWLALSGAMSRRSESEAIGSYESMEGVGESAWGSPSASETYVGSGYGYAPGVESSGYGGTTTGSEYATSGGNGQGQGMRDKAGQVAGQARETASRARERMGQWSRSAGSSARQAMDRTRDVYQDQPITMGIVALLAGAALGAVLPTTRRERETLGRTADRMMEEARETGSEMMDKAGHVAERAVKAAKEEGKQAMREEREKSASTTSSTMTH